MEAKRVDPRDTTDAQREQYYHPAKFIKNIEQ